MKIPMITTSQMVEVDRLMIEDFGISLMQMMENAGSRLADLAIRLMGCECSNKKVVVLCGGGNNGGGGMVAARHLHNRGVVVKVVITVPPDQLKEVPAKQLGILRKIGLQQGDVEDLCEADLILDCLIGYGLQRQPKDEIAEWIRLANNAKRPVLSLDAPSGLDMTSGIPADPCIRALATMTLALPKEGLVKAEAQEFVGGLFLADISVPPELYAILGLQVGQIFSYDTIVKL